MYIRFKFIEIFVDTFISNWLSACLSTTKDILGLLTRVNIDRFRNVNSY